MDAASGLVLRITGGDDSFAAPLIEDNDAQGEALRLAPAPAALIPGLKALLDLSVAKQCLWSDAYPGSVGSVNTTTRSDLKHFSPCQQPCQKSVRV